MIDYWIALLCEHPFFKLYIIEIVLCQSEMCQVNEYFFHRMGWAPKSGLQRFLRYKLLLVLIISTC